MSNMAHHYDPARLWMQPLDDIMDMICKYLNGKDLSKVAKVCKSWRCAALRESNRRYHFLQLPFRHKIDNLASTLYVIPSVSLFFFAGKYYAEDLIRDYKPQLPNDTIVMLVHKLYPKLSGKCNLLGMFLPSTEQRVSVRVSWTHNRSANLLAEDLGMNNNDPKSAIILLFCTYNHVDYMILAELCRKAQQKGEEITLASIFGRTLMATHYHTEMNECTNFKSTVALRISGSSIEFCSTFIPFSAREEEIKRKLEELKEKIKYKRFNTGLFYAPGCSCRQKCCCGNQVTMLHLERIFPNISFTGFSHMFTRGSRCGCLYTVNAINENVVFSEEFLSGLPFYASILIISYD